MKLDEVEKRRRVSETAGGVSSPLRPWRGETVVREPPPLSRFALVRAGAPASRRAPPGFASFSFIGARRPRGYSLFSYTVWISTDQKRTKAGCRPAQRNL